MYSDAGAAAVRFIVSMELIANTTPTPSAGVFTWIIQAGALGLLAWYFVRVEPQQRREEREARRKDLELLLQHRDRDSRQSGPK